VIKTAKIAFSVALLCAMSVSARAEILIATAGPMKGQYAALGEQLRQGASRAVADINASGGVNGEQLVLEVADDGCDPKQAMALLFGLFYRGGKNL
jgi:branched-chain amino acid transport system substrate-binding protein